MDLCKELEIIIIIALFNMIIIKRESNYERFTKNSEDSRLKYIEARVVPNAILPVSSEGQQYTSYSWWMK